MSVASQVSAAAATHGRKPVLTKDGRKLADVRKEAKAQIATARKAASAATKSARTAFKELAAAQRNLTRAANAVTKSKFGRKTPEYQALAEAVKARKADVKNALTAKRTADKAEIQALKARDKIAASTAKWFA